MEKGGLFMLLRRENFKEYIVQYPITAIIVAINTVVFIYTSFLGGLSDESVLYHVGGFVSDKFINGEYYRAITYAFIHNGLEHFGFNMVMTLIIGAPVEKLLGKAQYIVLFFVSILTPVLFFGFLTTANQVGESGFGFGLFGLLTSWVFLKRSLFDKDTRTAILLFVLVGWIITFVYPNVSFTGHFGGFLAGIILSFFFQVKNQYDYKQKIFYPVNAQV